MRGAGSSRDASMGAMRWTAEAPMLPVMSADPRTSVQRICEAISKSLASRPEVGAAYLYGSAARGEATSLSDIDIGLLFSEEASEPERRDAVAAGLGRDVARLLSAGREGDNRPPAAVVDVRDLEALPLAVQGRVLTEGMLVASRDEVRRVRFETLTRCRYFDFLPFQSRDVTEGLRALRERYRDA